MPIKPPLTIVLLLGLLFMPFEAGAAMRNFILYDAPRVMPKTNILDNTNKPIDLGAYRGSVVLLNVWATWCQPCRKEMPQLDGLQEKYGKDGLVVMAVSIEQGGLPAVRDFYKRYNISLLPYADPSGMLGPRVGADGIPYTLLINRTGLAVGATRGAVDWESDEALGLVKALLASKN